jgi:hypothetical protein
LGSGIHRIYITKKFGDLEWNVSLEEKHKAIGSMPTIKLNHGINELQGNRQKKEEVYKLRSVRWTIEKNALHMGLKSINRLKNHTFRKYSYLFLRSTLTLSIYWFGISQFDFSNVQVFSSTSS